MSKADLKQCSLLLQKAYLYIFYDVKWYNSKLPAQHQNRAYWKKVAFLHNPKCLLEFTSPDKKI
ncbi:hypothetical protein O181_129850, partial [Austropuccinia psidii MF-1]|nr:hypothetical protein [Austropuccinia psidii MF-1]